MKEIPQDIKEHYAAGLEDRRLETPKGVLERVRTEELLSRFLPAAPSRIADIGGGTGIYAAWLAAKGHEVELIDLIPEHVELARARFERVRVSAAARARVGDARRLDLSDGQFDVVLLLGPLYHLTERPDRLAALREGLRILAPGGTLFAVGISKFASTLDGLRGAFLRDPLFREIAASDLSDGRHHNPTADPSWFTTAYFHAPEELEREVRDAGLDVVGRFGIEGPGWLLPDLVRRLESPEGKDEVLHAARALESEPAIQGASAHLMVVGRKRVD